MNGLKGLWPASRSAPSAMLTAWSPMRSRSLLIFRTATRNRRSTATGCCRARSAIADSSIEISIRSTSSSAAMTSRLLRVHLGQRLDGAVDLPLDLATHQDEVAPEILELLGEMFLQAVPLLVALSPRTPRRTGSPGRSATPRRRRRHRAHATVRSNTRSNRSAFLRAASSSASQSPRALASSSTLRDRTRHETAATSCRWLRSSPSAIRRIRGQLLDDRPQVRDRAAASSRAVLGRPPCGIARATR